MATFVQATKGLNSAGSNQNLFTSNFGVACTAGNALIIGVCLDAASATITTISDNAASHNTYTQLGTYTASTLTIYLYQALNITANAGAVYQIQVTEPFLDGQIFAQEWSGMPTSGTLLDGSIVTNTGNSAATTTSSSISTTQTNELIFSILMLQNQTNTYTAGTGYSNLQNQASNFTSAGIESKAVAAASSNTASFGMTTTGTPYIQLTAALKTSASTGGGAVTAHNLTLLGVGS